MADKLTKHARKPAKDPDQEQLRQHKDEWNDVASLLIAKLIAFKRGLNGVGDPVADIPESKITEPLPPELEIYLQSIVNDYQDLVMGGKSIIDEQKRYSENFSKSSSADLFISEASNPFTRAWARVGLIGHPERSVRIQILDQISDLIADFYDLEHVLTGSNDPVRLARALLKYTSMLNLLGANLGTLLHEVAPEAFKESSSSKETKETKEKNFQPQEGAGKNKSQIKTEYEELAPEVIDQNTPMKQLDLIRDKIQGVISHDSIAKMLYQDDYVSIAEKARALDSLEKKIRGMIVGDPEGLVFQHQQAIQDMYNDYNALERHLQMFPVDKGDRKMPDIAPETQDFNSADDLEKLASNALVRWLNRQKLKLFPGNLGYLVSTAVEQLIAAREGLRHIADLAEDKESSMKEIVSAYKEVVANASKAANSIGKLGRIYVSEKKLKGDSKTITLTDSDLSKLNKSVLSLSFSGKK